MLVDLKEIPEAHKGGGRQDTFEWFARYFLEALGYKIVTEPNRGQDEGCDFVVSIKIKNKAERLLVSCKHKVHTGTNVSNQDESDIRDRIDQHNCKGIICFYSTGTTSGLEKKLGSMEGQKKYSVDRFYGEHIADQLLKNNRCSHVFMKYLDKSYLKYQEMKKKESESRKRGKSQTMQAISEDKILEISQTAIILIELAKVELSYGSCRDWEEKRKVLDSLWTYTEFQNERISLKVLELLCSATGSTRSAMPSEMAHAIESLAMEYFPFSYEVPDGKALFEQGKMCINIGFGLAYDAYLYNRNFAIASCGLQVLKYSFSTCQRLSIPELEKQVMKTYSEIEQLLNRIAEDDQELAKEMVKVFKGDIAVSGLIWPLMTDKLYNRIVADQLV